jgi:hypothetical protein
MLRVALPLSLLKRNPYILLLCLSFTAAKEDAILKGSPLPNQLKPSKTLAA